MMIGRTLVLASAIIFACSTVSRADEGAGPTSDSDSAIPVRVTCNFEDGGSLGVAVQNVSQRTIRLVRFETVVSGVLKETYTLTGAYLPGTLTKKRFTKGATGDLESAGSLTCVAAYVEFDDGGTWSYFASAAGVRAADAPEESSIDSMSASYLPVQLDACTGYTKDQNTAEVGISFHATSMAVTAVEFIFGVQDPFGNIATWYMGTTTGTFSPGVKIEPRRPSLNPAIFQSREIVPQNPAWSFLINQSDSPEQIKCAVYKARLADGSVWTNPTTKQISPVSAY